MRVHHVKKQKLKSQEADMHVIKCKLPLGPSDSLPDCTLHISPHNLLRFSKIYKKNILQVDNGLLFFLYRF